MRERETDRKRLSEEKNTKYKKKEITETGRQGGGNEREWAGKDCHPTTHHPTSVFIKRIVSISPGVEAFISLCRCLMSRGPSIVWCWRLQGLAGHGYVGRLSERQLSDYSPAGHSPLQVEWSVPYPFLHPFFPSHPSLHDSCSHETSELTEAWIFL